MSQQLAHYDEIDLKKYLGIIVRNWYLIALCSIAMMAFSFFYNVMQEPVYEAKTTLLVRSGGGGAISPQFAGLAGLAGISLPSGGGSIGDLTEILQSKAIAAKVAKDLDLKNRVEKWRVNDTADHKIAQAVQGMLKHAKSSGNMVELRVEYTDPELTAEIANAFIGALAYYWNALNYSEAQKKREYVEGQLPRIEADLKKAEWRLKNFTKLGILPTAQTQNIEIARLTRELEIQNSVYTMLRKEYETVKLEESKEILPFSVLDIALKPEKPIRPKVPQGTAIGLVFGLMAGIFLAFFRNYWNTSA